MSFVTRSLCVPTGDSAAVKECVLQWIEARGFEPREAVPQWPCDEELERCAFLVSNERWTILLYSGMDEPLDEDNRLILHCARLDLPLLYLWSHVGVWGYRIHEGREVLDAFNSNPRQFDPDWTTEHPGHGDFEYLKSTFDFDVSVPLLSHISRSRVIARGHVFGRFCHALGLSPAAAGYAVMESRFLARAIEPEIAGFKVQRVYLAKRNYSPSTTRLDIHALTVKESRSSITSSWPQFEIPAEMHGYIIAWMRLRRLLQLVTLPIAWLLRLAVWNHRFYEWAGLDRRSGHTDPFLRVLENDPAPEFSVEGDRLVSRLRGCALLLPPGVRYTPSPFAHTLRLDRVELAIDMVRGDATGHIRRQFQPFPDWDIVVDERPMAGLFPARIVERKLSSTTGGRYYIYAVLQLPRAFLELASHQTGEADHAKAAAAVRAILRSIEVWETDPSTSVAESASSEIGPAPIPP